MSKDDADEQSVLSNLGQAKESLDLFLAESDAYKHKLILESRRAAVQRHLSDALIANINQIQMSLRAGAMNDLEALEDEHNRLRWLKDATGLYFDIYQSDLEDCDNVLSSKDRSFLIRFHQQLENTVFPIPAKLPEKNTESSKYAAFYRAVKKSYLADSLPVPEPDIVVDETGDVIEVGFTSKR